MQFTLHSYKLSKAVDVQQKCATDNLGLGKLTSSITEVPDSESAEMQAMVTKVTENLSTLRR